MANRTTPNDVLALVPQVETGFVPTPFINQANRFINRVLVVPQLVTDEVLLKDLEMYLAAHFITIIHPVLASESGTGVSGSYSRVAPGKGLNSTPAGQLAKALDTTGELEVALAGGNVPQLFIMGGETGV